MSHGCGACTICFRRPCAVRAKVSECRTHLILDTCGASSIGWFLLYVQRSLANQKKLDPVVASALRDISHKKKVWGQTASHGPVSKSWPRSFSTLVKRSIGLPRQVHHAPHSFTQRTKLEGEGAHRSKCDQIQTIASLKDILLCKSVLCTKMHNHGPAIGGESQAPHPAACLPKFAQALFRGPILSPETPIVGHKLWVIELCCPERAVADSMHFS